MGSGGNGKMSEMRRKRIQELEGKIAVLNKKQLEQQRLLKLNSQNEAKMKKYAEEILQMKQMKVKLIKQMKEENEKVRQWKAVKEKEVNQLKQKERRAQVAMTSMSQKHERRENVLKRKMEEANATTKRLKDALAKKEAVRKQKVPSGTSTLSGAGERVRGWLSSEVEFEVTSKEAEKSKVQLIKERKAMTEELNKLRQDLRRTTTAQEREEAQAKQQKLQSELDIRNAQISELQQQILGIEQDKEKESKQDKWTKLSSMVEAKLAVQYLFEQATDSMAAASAKTTELKEVTLQYEELRVVRNELKEEILKMKMNHEDEVVRLEREHEEKILFLLRQLPGEEVPETKDVSLNHEISDVEKRLKFQAEEIAKMSEIHDQLLDRDREVAKLNEELKRGAEGRASFMPRIGPVSPLKKDMKKRVTIAVERLTDEEWGCTCIGCCKTTRCSCRKADSYCSAVCKCDSSKCSNKMATCDVCGKGVSSRSLKNHKLLHTGEVHKCEFCEYTAVQKGNLKTHRMKLHKDLLEKNESSENPVGELVVDMPENIATKEELHDNESDDIADQEMGEKEI